MRTITNIFPTASSYGEVQEVVKDVMEFINIKEKDGDYWHGITIQDFYSMLVEKYGKDSVESSQEKTMEYFLYGIPSDTLSLIGDREVKDYLLLIGTLCNIHGADTSKVLWVAINVIITNFFNWNNIVLDDGIKIAHAAPVYLAWMSQKKEEAFITKENNIEYVPPGAIEGSNKKYIPGGTIISVACPVDIAVYDRKGNTAAVVKGHTVVEANIPVITDSETTTIYFPVAEEYTINITATNSGTMTYTVMEMDIEQNVVNRINYYDIELNKDMIFKGEVDTISDYVDGKYDLIYIENGVETIIPADERLISNFEVTLAIETVGEGVAIGGGTYIKGDTVGLTAYADESSHFLGWYVNGNLVSTDKVYNIRLLENTKVTCMFETDEVHEDTYIVSFDLQGHGMVLDEYTLPIYMNLAPGSLIKEPTEPSDNDYIFTGWYKDVECTALWNFEIDMIQSDIILYAGWKQKDSGNSDDDPKEDLPDDILPDDPSEVLPGDIPSDGKIPQGLWIAGIDESYPYTGKAIKPAVRVYDGDKRLKAGRDYSISYKNNIKASDVSNNQKAPAVVVKGKGNYAGTETAVFKILAANIDDVTVESLTLAYADKIQKKVPVLTYNGKKLVKEKDFMVDYPDKMTDAYKATGTYKVVLTGKGNFVGTKTADIIITDKTLISKATVAKIPNQVYNEREQTPPLTVTMKGVPLKEGTDYTVRYENNTEVGTAKAILTGTGDNYAGTKKVTFKITGTPLKGAVITGTEGKAYTYTGTAHMPDIVVDLNGKPLTKGTDYKVSYSNNIKAGKATIIVQGIRAYTGTVKKTFKIAAYDLNDQKVQIEGPDQKVKYAKGGSKPKIGLTFSDMKLTEGKDYTISYQNNKSVTVADTQKRPQLTIKGKGNFKGTLIKDFSIISKALGDEEAPVTLAVADIAYIDKAGKYISKPVLTDADGKKLVAGIDYESKGIYTLENGKALTGEDIVDANTNIKVKVTGKGAYYGELETTYRVTKSDFNKAKIKIPAQAYTGKEIILAEKDITVKIGDIMLSPGIDYEIVKGSYHNNVKKGTATVKIVGKGNYGGTKTIKFKIVSKRLVWFWRLF